VATGRHFVVGTLPVKYVDLPDGEWPEGRRCTEEERDLLAALKQQTSALFQAAHPQQYRRARVREAPSPSRRPTRRR